MAMVSDHFNEVQRMLYILWLTGVNEQGEPNNVVYKDVVIDYERVAKLPEEDFFVKNMRTVDCDNGFENDYLPDIGPLNDDSKVFDENSEIFSFLLSKVNVKKEADIVKDIVFSNKMKLMNGKLETLH